MSDEGTVTVSEEREQTADGDGYVQLDEEAERDLLSNVAASADGVDGDVEGLGELQEQLMGYQTNSEREEAWVRGILLPGREVDGWKIGEQEVGVEFLLPSGDAITRTYDLPDKRWTEDNEFARLLDETGVEPSTLETLVGEPVDVSHDGDRWVVQTTDATDAKSSRSRESRARETREADTSGFDSETEDDSGSELVELVKFCAVFFPCVALVPPLMLGLQELGVSVGFSGFLGLAFAAFVPSVLSIALGIDPPE